MTTANLHSLPARLLFRLRHNPWPARFRAFWLRLCGARIGRNTSIRKVSMTWPHQVQIGNRCILEPEVLFKFDGVWRPGPAIIIDDDVFIGRGCEFNIRQSVRLGKHCLIGSGSKFIDHDHGLALGQPMRQQAGPEAAISIGSDVWIGDNVIVLKGVVIGDGAVVAAGAVLNRNVAPFEIWGGIPARKIGERK